jgi:ribosome biogenesis GTPase
MDMTKALIKGKVMRSTGSWYQVLTSGNETIECRIMGKFRLKGVRTTNPVVVGDHVGFEHMQDGTGVIREIEDRRNYIVRKSVNLSRQDHIIAANVDHAYLVATLVAPPTSTEFIDRFLVTAEANRVPVTVVFNKKDIYAAPEHELLETLVATYTSIGYECMSISAFDSESIEMFRNRLNHNVNLLSGHSGVGKSTLINHLEKGLDLKTAGISEHHSEGKHTTTFADIFPLSNNGFIIDTPGIKGFGIVHIDKENIAHYFPEMHRLLSKCKFSNCIHINEPGCAVKEAVEDGTIAESRYHSYLSIYDTDETENYR